ncbi:MAG: hypothetical protein KDE58_32400 [Caldilineaceae bacterium]|nr:hypothetical protein [Caldilineaceae bacterium]
MNPHSPILDQPQVIDWEKDAPHFSYRLANSEIVFEVDADTDLCNLFLPWANEEYAKRITLAVSAPREETLMPLVTRLYPGHQEQILGTEGVILTKRVAVPYQGDYDRTVLWVLDCQAEGDRLLRLDVTIDWGEPLTQRMVDGLLVAQRNPGPLRGIYSQSNAELTCVFGNPDARPDQVDLNEPNRAHLVYHVLVNGMVEVPLLLTLSDVGEQIAWNGFLAMRDAERAFQLSTKAWERMLKRGRLWTPDPPFNRAIQQGKLTAVRHLQRVRSGAMATDRTTTHSAALVAMVDSFDVTSSRNLLANLRRIAESTMGRLPETLPLRPKEEPVDPGPAVAQTNGAYLRALAGHLRSHFDAKLLADHYTAIGLCAEQLCRLLEATSAADTDPSAAEQGLHAAVALARWQGDADNVRRWQALAGGDTVPTMSAITPASVHYPESAPFGFADVWHGIIWSGEAFWQSCGLSWQRGALHVAQTWPATWPWWAVLDLPYIDDRTVSILWDGNTLHSTQPLQSPLPTQQWDSIRPLRTDELEFDLHFALQSEQDDLVTHNTFRPRFFNK